MARIPLPDREDLPDEYQYLLSEDVLGDRNVFRAIANNPEVLQSFMRYGGVLWDGGLSVRERELVILAVARGCDSNYEWHQHVELGREAGISNTELAAIGREQHEDFDGRERALLAYGAALVDGSVTDPIHDDLADHYGTDTIITVTMLASHYFGLARALDSLAVPLEEEFIGWEPEN